MHNKSMPPAPAGADRSAFSRPMVMTLLVCGLIMLVDGYETQAMSYALPSIAAQWSLSKAALGPLLSAALTGSIIGFCGAPSVSCRVGHKRMALISMLCFAVLMLITTLVRDFNQLVAVRLCTGLSLGAIIPSVIALAYRASSPTRRATSIVLIYCCFSLGFALAAVAAASLLGHFGWHVLFALGGAVPLLLLPALAAWRPHIDTSFAHPTTAPSSPALMPVSARSSGKLEAVWHVKDDLIALFSSRPASATLLIWLSFALINSEFYFMQGWLPSMLTTLHFSIESLALITGLSTVGGALSALLIGPAMDRFERHAVVAWLFVASALFVGAIGLSLHQPAWLLMLMTFCAGFCVSGVLKSLIALAALFYSSEVQPIGSGWSLGAGRVGGALGPALVGALYSAGVSPSWIFLVATLPLLSGAGIVLLIRDDQRKARSARPLPDE